MGFPFPPKPGFIIEAVPNADAGSFVRHAPDVVNKFADGELGDFAFPDGPRPVEVNTDEAGWKHVRNDVPTYPGEATAEEYVVDLAKFGDPSDPARRMQWMSYLQSTMPPPDEDYESRSVVDGKLVGGPLRK